MVGQAAHAEVVAEQQRQADDDDRHGRRLHAHGEAADDVGGRAGERGLGDGADGAVAGFGVVLGDADEQERGDDADDAGAEQPPAALQHEVHGGREAQQRHERGDVVAAVERVHRVFVFSGMHDGDADDARR